MAKPKERLQARKLRQQGKSIKEIAKEIGVSPSTVSRWTRDIELTPQQIKNLEHQQKQWGNQNKGAQKSKTLARENRQQYQQAGRDVAKEADILHMQGCLLYWTEGSKDRNRLEFVNSDVNMMKLFLKFLTNSLNVSKSDVILRVHCHTQDHTEITNIKLYWSNQLNVPLSAFKYTYIKEGSDSRKNRLDYGICSIRIDNTELVQHIFGAIQEYGGFDNPDWLG